MENKIIIWIFCKIIDNFGDAGVCLRLTNLLSEKHNFDVTTWIDNLNILHKLQNNIDYKLNYQSLNKIKFFNLQDFNNIYNFEQIPNCVIEIFGCGIPDKILQIIEKNKILWINLEYLSAEKWTQDYHLMKSFKPNNVKQYFYFQGFTKQSGGLIREKNYTLKKQQFLENKYNFLNQNNIYYEQNKIKIFIFGYQNLIWEETIKTLQLINKPIIIWFANHSLLDNLSNELLQKYNYNKKNNTYVYSNITIQKVEFVEQQYFDYYLLICDIAIVRGEDSFVRAQLLSKIFLWNIYFQEDKAHIAKLNAFLDILKKYIPYDLFKSIYQLSMEINDIDYKLNLKYRLENWQNIIYNIEKSNFKNWNNFLINQETAIEKLTRFIKKQVKI